MRYKYDVIGQLCVHLRFAERAVDRYLAAVHLEGYGPRAWAAVSDLCKAMLSDVHPQVRERSAKALQAIGPAAPDAAGAAPLIARALWDAEPAVSQAAFFALRTSTSVAASAVPVLIDGLK